ncbi:hypothetical protein CAMRE0001_0326 [Campylobacter rectus RM3267]|uniref:Uncharacterized protein n=1 Tax=Campylobacter rectus RM3267 TaxID=553218 RepID=B9CYB6_CAMRE|nr:hypothetical protein CAMRE0001_0326 [Campylobacter rectus RM3267]
MTRDAKRYNRTQIYKLQVNKSKQKPHKTDLILAQIRHGF